jgi:hypothetical protein
MTLPSDTAADWSGAQATPFAELAAAVAGAASVDELCDRAVEAVTSSLVAERASVLLFDEHGVMRFRSWKGLSDAYRAATDGHSPWAPDTPDAPRLHREAYAGPRAPRRDSSPACSRRRSARRRRRPRGRDRWQPPAVPRAPHGGHAARDAPPGASPLAALAGCRRGSMPRRRRGRRSCLERDRAPERPSERGLPRRRPCPAGRGRDSRLRQRPLARAVPADRPRSRARIHAQDVAIVERDDGAKVVLRRGASADVR